AWKVSIISAAPFFAGLAIVLFLAQNVFNIGEVLAILQSGTLNAFTRALSRLVAAPDFWLWAYILFTISNTMTPELKQITSLRWVWIGLAAVLLPLLLIGVGDEVVGTALTGPVADVLNFLTTAFLIIIVFDLLAIGLLAVIENSIEFVTGDSATFKNGKMVVMTREEAHAEREKERKKERTRKEKRREAAAAGPPSVYKLSFPLPGAPGEEPVSTGYPTIVEPSERQSVRPGLERPRREEPSVIPGAATRPEIKFNTARGEREEEKTREEPRTAATDRPEAASGVPPRRFGQALPSGARPETYEDQDEDGEGTSSRQASSGTRPSRLGSSPFARPSQPSRVPQSGPAALEDDDIDEEIDDTDIEDSDADQGYRPARVSGPFPGSARPSSTSAFGTRSSRPFGASPSASGTSASDDWLDDADEDNVDEMSDDPNVNRSRDASPVRPAAFSFKPRPFGSAVSADQPSDDDEDVSDDITYEDAEDTP
ncbi:MAG: hypothetical protein ACOCX5_00865, partial [Chloroflexota bacterium]